MKFNKLMYLVYPLLLPQALVGLLLGWLVYGARKWKWNKGVLEATCKKKMIGNPDAQTHGFIIYYRDSRVRSDVGLRVHERVHVLQAVYLLGIPFVLLYSLAFLWHYAKGGFKDWYTAYYQNPMEQMAYRIQREYYAGSRNHAWGAEGNPRRALTGAVR